MPQERASELCEVLMSVLKRLFLTVPNYCSLISVFNPLVHDAHHSER